MAHVFRARLLLLLATLGIAGLLGGCVVYPATPGYVAYPVYPAYGYTVPYYSGGYYGGWRR